MRFAIADLWKKSKIGVFYRNRAALLHFHEDGAAFFADLKTGSEWIRYPVKNRTDEQRLLAALRKVLKTN